MIQRPLEIHTKLFSFLVWYLVSHLHTSLPYLIVVIKHKSATETDLRREFEGFGTIERVRIVRDKKSRSRGYAFIVYERERDMKGLSSFCIICFFSY